MVSISSGQSEGAWTSQSRTQGSETVWNTPGDGSTGGGVSRQFALPSYQSAAKVPAHVDSKAAGRGVPDVSGNADPNAGYQIRVDGNDQTIAAPARSRRCGRA